MVNLIKNWIIKLKDSSNHLETLGIKHRFLAWRNIKYTTIVLMHDIVMSLIAFVITYYCLGYPKLALWKFLSILIIFGLVSAFSFFWTHSHQQIWHARNLQANFKMMLATFLSSCSFYPLSFLIMENSSIKFCFILWGMLMLALSITRFYGMYKRQKLPINSNKRVICAAILNELPGLIEKARSENYDVIGAITQDPLSLDQRVGNVAIIGDFSNLPLILETLDTPNIDAIVTYSDVDPLLLNLSEAHHIPVIIINSIAVDNKLLLSNNPIDFGMINYLKILGRAPLKFQTTQYNAYLKNKRILVTDVHGFIVHNLLDHLYKAEVSSINILIDHQEDPTSILAVLRNIYKEVAIDLYPIDFSDEHSIESAFAKAKPEIVIHEATFYNLQKLETKAQFEGIREKITLTKKLLEVAKKYKLINSFICLTEDYRLKNPDMLSTVFSRLIEMYMGYLDQNMTQRFVVLRLPDVLNSPFSIAQEFIDAAQGGDNIRIVDPNAMGLFITLEEASPLILNTIYLSSREERIFNIYTLVNQEPVRILDIGIGLINNYLSSQCFTFAMGGDNLKFRYSCNFSDTNIKIIKINNKHIQGVGSIKLKRNKIIEIFNLLESAQYNDQQYSTLCMLLNEIGDIDEIALSA